MAVTGADRFDLLVSTHEAWSAYAKLATSRQLRRVCRELAMHFWNLAMAVDRGRV